jgi:ABC-type Fe3+ transport system substrate-binding protein
VAYNADVVKPSDVATWRDLLNPKLKGKIVCYDPTSPGPGAGALAAMAKVLGMDYVTKLIKDQQVKFVQNSDQEMASVAHGEYPIGLALTTQEIVQYQSDGINIKVSLPSPMPGYVTHPNGVIIEAVGAPNPNAAQVFINWWASQRGQQTYQDEARYISNRTDVDKSKMPSFIIPKPGAQYFDDGRGQNYYVTERKQIIASLTAMIGR